MTERLAVSCPHCRAAFVALVGNNLPAVEIRCANCGARYTADLGQARASRNRTAPSTLGRKTEAPVAED